MTGVVKQYVMKRLEQAHVLGRLLSSEFDAIHLAIGHLESQRVHGARYSSIQEAEFQVFSQFGDDGIIQFLVSHIPNVERSFVELGVNDYRESNTRFLLEHDSWEGFIVDAGDTHIAFLDSPYYQWRHRIWATSAFLDVDNVNSVISNSGFSGEIGLLSIDLDGNDYWILEAIDVVSPQLLVLEYNSVFGPDHAVTIPYDAKFAAAAAHPSGAYFGASLPALCDLAKEKGFQFVGSNSAGVNAYFVRSDLASHLPRPSAHDGWVASRHRLPSDGSQRLSRSAIHQARLRLLSDLPLRDLVNNRTVLVRNLYDAS